MADREMSMCCEEIRPNSWQELVNELFRDCALQEHIMRYRSLYAYRGLSDSTYNLKTSLIRLHDKKIDCCQKVEPHLLKNFIKYSREDYPSFTQWQWLCTCSTSWLTNKTAGLDFFTFCGATFCYCGS